MTAGEAVATVDRMPSGLADTAAAIARGDVTAVAYAGELLRRIEDNADLCAFITVSPEQLLSAAEHADATARSAPDRLPPLHGVPIAVKDNIDTADLPTTGGTPALWNHRPAADAGVVAALRRAGAIVLGKTNLHELAYGVTSENHAFGAVRNPYDRERFAGGSSGGTAAAVSAGLAPAGLGTDTGGSVRIPAALCGIVGLRPTIGRYSARGLMSVSTTRDTVGPMARTVTDVALLDAALSGLAQEVPSLADLRGMRFGLARRQFFDGMAHEVSTVVERRLTELERRGVEVVEVTLPPETDDLIVGAGFPIAFYETPITLQAYLEATPGAPSLADLVAQCGSPDVRQILTSILGDGRVALADYNEALTVHRPQLARIFESAFERHDLAAFVAPSTPLSAARLGATEAVLGDKRVPAFSAYTRTTGPFSGIGWPGLTVPAGLDDNGLPVGLAFDAPPGSDRTLLAIGTACERVFADLPAVRGGY